MEKRESRRGENPGMLHGDGGRYSGACMLSVPYFGISLSLGAYAKREYIEVV